MAETLWSLAAVIFAMTGWLAYLDYRTKRRLEPTRKERADTNRQTPALTTQPASLPDPTASGDDEPERAVRATMNATTARAVIVILIYADSYSMGSATKPERFGNMVEELSTTAILKGLFWDVKQSVRAHLNPNLAPETED